MKRNCAALQASLWADIYRTRAPQTIITLHFSGMVYTLMILLVGPPVVSEVKMLDSGLTRCWPHQSSPIIQWPTHFYLYRGSRMGQLPIIPCSVERWSNRARLCIILFLIYPCSLVNIFHGGRENRFGEQHPSRRCCFKLCILLGFNSLNFGFWMHRFLNPNQIKERSCCGNRVLHMLKRSRIELQQTKIRRLHFWIQLNCVEYLV